MAFLKARSHRTLGVLLAFCLINIVGLSIGRNPKPFQVSSEKAVTGSILPTVGVRGEPNQRLRRSIQIARPIESRVEKRSPEGITDVETAVEDLSFATGIKDPIGLTYDPIGLPADSLHKKTLSSRPLKLRPQYVRGDSSYPYRTLPSPVLSRKTPWDEAHRNPLSAFNRPERSPTELTSTKVAPFQPQEVGFRLTDYLPVPDWESLGRKFEESTERWNTLNAEIEEDRLALGFIRDDPFAPEVHAIELRSADERKKEVERIAKARKSARARALAAKYKTVQDRLIKALKMTRRWWIRLKASWQRPAGSTVILTAPMNPAIGFVNPTLKMTVWLSLFENAMDNLRKNLSALKVVSPAARKHEVKII